MPPRKRKAGTSLSPVGAAKGASSLSSSATPHKKTKLSKKEQLARARAWHESRKAGGSTPAASAKSSSAAAPAPAAPATVASFKAGKPPPTPATATAKRRRATAGRKSTGGIGLSGSSGSRTRVSSRTPSPTTVKREPAAKRGRRASAESKFEFKPLVADGGLSDAKSCSEDDDNVEEEKAEEEETKAIEPVSKIAKRGRRASAESKSELKPPIADGGLSDAKSCSEDDDDDDDDEEEDVNSKNIKTKNDHDEDESDNESEKKQPAKKRGREDGLARIRALREEREKKGKPVAHRHSLGGDHHAATAASTQSTAASATRPRQRRRSPSPEERKRPPEPERKSPDPPAAASARTLQLEPTATTTASATTRPRYQSPDPPARSSPPSATRAQPSSRRGKSKTPAKNKPPASVAALFAAPKSKKSSSAHRPYKQKFDPNKPYPTGGYKLPTAAYCGCGPTPGSITSSVRGSTTTGAGAVPVGGGADLCVVNPTMKRGNSFTLEGAAAGSSNLREVVRESMQLISPVDPPYRKKYNGGGEDERKLPAGPSPPGRNAADRWEERADRQLASLDDHGQSATAGNGSAVQQAKAKAPISAPVADNANAQLLGGAISRARAMVSSVAISNQQRRAMMGIHSNNNNSNNNNGVIQSGAQTDNGVGMPPRNVLQIERAETKPAVENVIDDVEESEKGPMDPPTVVSAPVARADLRQKFQDDGGASNNVRENIADDVPSDNNATATTTVAGEPTSESGENEELNSSVKEEYESETKPPSFLKRGCLAIFKIVMFVQLAFGIMYLVTNYAPFDFNLSISTMTSTKQLPAPDGVIMQEPESLCFLDHPAQDNNYAADKDRGDDDGNYDRCEGRYRQCPQWGRCHGKELRDCTDGGGLYDGMQRFVPNANGDLCVLSDDAALLIEEVKEALVAMTVGQTCKSWDRITDKEHMRLFEEDDDQLPLFSLTKMAEIMQESIDRKYGEENKFRVTSELLLWLLPAFADDDDSVRFGSLSGDDGDDIDSAGLGTGFSHASLPLGFYCTLKHLSWELLGYFGKSALALLQFSVKNIWSLASTYPLYAIAAFALLKLALMFRRRRQHRAKVNDLFAIVLEATYDRLAECDDSDGGYAALLLRDDLGHDMYPTSWSKRQWMNDHVWPRVKLEILADNRVRKFRRVTNGKDLEHWDFAIQSKRGRRLRKSLGSPPCKPFGSPGSDGVSNASATKGLTRNSRDP